MNIFESSKTEQLLKRITYFTKHSKILNFLSNLDAKIENIYQKFYRFFYCFYKKSSIPYLLRKKDKKIDLFATSKIVNFFLNSYAKLIYIFINAFDQSRAKKFLGKYIDF